MVSGYYHSYSATFKGGVFAMTTFRGQVQGSAAEQKWFEATTHQTLQPIKVKNMDSPVYE